MKPCGCSLQRGQRFQQKDNMLPFGNAGKMLHRAAQPCAAQFRRALAAVSHGNQHLPGADQPGGTDRHLQIRHTIAPLLFRPQHIVIGIGIVLRRIDRHGNAVMLLQAANLPIILYHIRGKGVVDWIAAPKLYVIIPQLCSVCKAFYQRQTLITAGKHPKFHKQTSEKRAGEPALFHLIR